MTPELIANLAASELGIVASLTGKVQIATAIALAESGGTETAISPTNADGTIDVGLWQINSVHRRDHPTWTTAWLQNPRNNAKAMATVSRGGSDWTPWVTYKNKEYLKFMSQSPGASTDPISGVIDDVTGAVDDVTGAVDAVTNFGEWFTKSENLLRLAQISGGILLALIAAAVIATPTINRVR